MTSPEGLAIKTAHAGKLADLLFRTARSGVRHNVNGLMLPSLS